MNTIKSYLNKILGEQVSIYPVTEGVINKIPYYLGNLYTLWEGELLTRHVYFANFKGEELLTTDQFRKQMDSFQEILEAPVILVLKGVESYNRNRLIQKNINFILENKQLFLPSLLIDLKDYLKPPPVRKEYLVPAAQYILLFHLQKQSLNSITYRDLTKIIPYNYLTVSRAAENLDSLGICEKEGIKAKVLKFDEDKKSLWKKAVPYLSNPIKKKIYIQETLPPGVGSLTGINALSHYTNIGGAIMDQYAISFRDFQKLLWEGHIHVINENYAGYNLELWKYPPIKSDNLEYVDPLSLYLIFQSNKNERIEYELKSILERIL